MRNIGVGLGLLGYPFDSAAGYWRWVDLCEAGGVDSLWQSDRMVGAEPALECLTAIAAIAGRTRRLKFGMNVLSVALRDPVLTAKQCATIDVLSEGRLLPAFGIGAPTAPEWAALHADTKTRGSRTDEGLEIIRRLWTGEPVDFEGRHFRLTAARIAPKPVQPDLPLWIGGSSEAAILRTARIGTGWQGGSESPDEVAPLVAAIKAAALAAGRSIDEDHYGIGFPFRFGSPEDAAVAPSLAAYRKRLNRDPSAYFVVGTAADILDRLAAYWAAGISKFVLRPIARGDDDMLAQTRLLVEQVLPEVARRWPKVRKTAP
jgi:probable F420-dependent oxidoreductase